MKHSMDMLFVSPLSLGVRCSHIHGTSLCQQGEVEDEEDEEIADEEEQEEDEEDEEDENEEEEVEDEDEDKEVQDEEEEEEVEDQEENYCNQKFLNCVLLHFYWSDKFLNLISLFLLCQDSSSKCILVKF